MDFLMATGTNPAGCDMSPSAVVVLVTEVVLEAFRLADVEEEGEER